MRFFTDLLMRNIASNQYGPGATFSLLTKLVLSTEMVGYWPSSFFFYGPRGSRGPNNAKKKDLGQYPAILTEQAWSIKDLLQKAKRLH